MTLKTDIDQIAVDAGQLHDIVHGGPTAVVATDGGSVKSVAKAIADLEVQIVTEAGSYVDLCQDEVALATAQAQTATNQAAAAAGSALSAASVVAQDLSAIDRTVYTGTNITAAILYDTSKDSDGGAWRKRCSHTSWENETLSGNWLGSAANEAAARAISGATTGSYYYDTTTAVFYTLNAGSGKTATYRGNVKQFPAQVLIMVTTDRLIIWDITQAGCPMWMVFMAAANYALNGTLVAPSLTARDGSLVVGNASASNGSSWIRFVADRAVLMRVSGINSYIAARLSGRNANMNFVVLPSYNPIATAVNAAAIAVMPAAPGDVASGLPVPTIALATDGNATYSVSVIKDDGTVVNIADDSTGSAVGVEFDGLALKVIRSDGTVYVWNDVRALTTGASPSATITASSTPALLGTASKMCRRGKGSSTGLTVLRRNQISLAVSMLAYVTKDYNSGWQVGAIKGSWLADSAAETLTGAELVTNGTFATDISGWSAYGSGGTPSWDASGAIKILNDGTGTVQCVEGQPITCVAGKTYVVSADLTASSLVNGYVQIGTASNNAATANVVASGGAGSKFLFSFVATQTTHYLRLSNGNTTANAYQIFDNVSIRHADPDRSIKSKGLQAFGSLTKVAAASGAGLMAYSGFGSGAYLEQPYNPDLDFGTGDFCVMGWVKFTSLSASVSLAQMTTSAGQTLVWTDKRWDLYLYATGSLTWQVGTAVGAGGYVTMASAPLSITDYSFICLTYISGVATLYIDGRQVAAASVSLATANAYSKFCLGGQSAAGSTNNRYLALWRVSATPPTADQIKHIYESEKGLFATSAQCCLAGTSNAVTALAYDEETDLLHVGTSYGRSAFKGLVRVASEATPVGSIVALAAGAGVIAQAGATAVDVYVPAYSLREELLRDAEQMARFGQNLIAHDFTATASQTTFSLPVGWEIVAVYQQGSIKRETTSWTRSFDGFVWSVVLGTGATVSDWISILAKRV